MAKLKFLMVNNIQLDGRYARSVQVKANAEAFGRLLGSDFRLFCYSSDSINMPFLKTYLRRFDGRSESNMWRKLGFLIASISQILSVHTGGLIFSRNLYVLYLASIFGRVPVFEIHGEQKGFNRRIIQKLSNKLKVIAISKALKEYLISEALVNDEQIFVAHDGVFYELYSPLLTQSKEHLRRTVELPLDKKIIMHTGSLYQGRGIELFESILKAFPDHLLVQIGGVEADVEYWKSYFKDYQNLIFRPHTDEPELLARYQVSADYLFYPITKNTKTWWCCSPMKIFEFMATGNPIIGSNIGSVGEVLTESNTFTFNPESESSLINALIRAFEDDDNARERAQLALKQVRKKYDWNIRIRNICAWLEI